MADLAASPVRYDRTRLRAILVTALAYSALFHLVVHAQRGAGAGPADDASPDRGRTVFVQNCGFCHGTDARGGAEGGTDITVSPIVTADQSGSTLGPFLRVGRPERKMPPFALPPEQVSDISAYLRSLLAPSGRGRGRGGPPPVAIEGNAKAGEAFFHGAGKCSTCHSVTGDLKGIGARLAPAQLQGRIVLPRGNGGYPRPVVPGAPNNYPDVPKRVTVTLASGETHTGRLLTLTDFHVTLLDSSGTRRSFSRRKDTPTVVVTDPLEGHLQMLPTLKDSDMHNLTAYLVTIR
jgi:cytochrome c oxidase cbb3-type subunit 3